MYVLIYLKQLIDFVNRFYFYYDLSYQSTIQNINYAELTAIYFKCLVKQNHKKNPQYILRILWIIFEYSN